MVRSLVFTLCVAAAAAAAAASVTAVSEESALEPAHGRLQQLKESVMLQTLGEASTSTNTNTHAISAVEKGTTTTAKSCSSAEWNQASTFHDIYIGFGYDVFKGDPQPVSGYDEGIKSSVFDVSKYNGCKLTSDQRHRVPDYTTFVTAGTNCDSKATATTIRSGKDYTDSLSIGIKSEGEMTMAPFTAGFTASSQFKYVTNTVQNKNSFVEKVTIKCNVYSASIDFGLSPPFSANFIAFVKRLPTSKAAFKSDASKTTMLNFLNEFGTHVITKAAMGGRYTKMSSISESSYMKMKQLGISVTLSAKAGVDGVASGSNEISTDIGKTDIDSLSRVEEDTQAQNYGGSFPNDNSPEAMKEWYSTCVDSPAPMEMELKRIDALLTKQTGLSKYAPAAKYAVDNYCTWLKDKGVLTACVAPAGAEPLYVDNFFGGMYQVDDCNHESTELGVVNPYTGGLSCPNNLYSSFVFAYSNNPDSGAGCYGHQFMCLKTSYSNPQLDPKSVFGGAYMADSGESVARDCGGAAGGCVNPLTKARSCPSEYTAHVFEEYIHPKSRKLIKVWVCLKGYLQDATTSPVGGFYQIVDGTQLGLWGNNYGYNGNGIASCPTGYEKKAISHNFYSGNNRHGRGYVCMPKVE